MVSPTPTCSRWPPQRCEDGSEPLALLPADEGPDVGVCPWSTLGRRRRPPENKVQRAEDGRSHFEAGGGGEEDVVRGRPVAVGGVTGPAEATQGSVAGSHDPSMEDV